MFNMIYCLGSVNICPEIGTYQWRRPARRSHFQSSQPSTALSWSVLPPCRLFCIIPGSIISKFLRTCLEIFGVSCKRACMSGGFLWLCWSWFGTSPSASLTTVAQAQANRDLTRYLNRPIAIYRSTYNMLDRGLPARVSCI